MKATRETSSKRDNLTVIDPPIDELETFDDSGATEDSKDPQDDSEEFEPINLDGVSANKSGDERAKPVTSNVTATTSNPEDNIDIEKRKWPKPPSVRMSWDVAELYFNQFTTAHWCHFNAYMYRAKPVIIRAKGEGNIDKFIGNSDGRDGRFNYQYIKDTHGGGIYKFVVNDTDNRKQQTFTISLDISLNESEPKLNYRELDIGAKENKAYIESLVLRGLLTSDYKVKEDVEMANNQNAGEVIKETTNLITNVLKMKDSLGSDKSSSPEMIQMLRMLQDQTNKTIDALTNNKPEKGDLGNLETLVGLLSKLMPAKESSSSNDKLLAVLLETNSTMMKVLLERKEAPVTPTIDPITQMNSMMDLFGKMNERFGNKGGSNEDTGPYHRPSTLETIVNAAPAILEPLAQIFTGLMAARAGVPFIDPNATNAPQQANTGATGNPIPGMPQQLPAAINQPQTTTQPTGWNTNPMVQQQQPNSEIKAQLTQLVQLRGQMLIDAIFTNKHGGDFAQSVIDMFGTDVYAKVCSLGSTEIVNVFKSVPPFWNILAPKENETVKFVEEFIKGPDSDEGVTDELEEKVN